MAGTRRRYIIGALKNMAALILGTIIALAVGEMGSRCYLFGLDAFHYNKVQSFGSLFRMGLVQRSSTEGLTYELKPDLDTYFKTVRFKTNHHGLRDGPCEMTKPSGTYRVAMIGDSFTMGSGVQHDHLFHTLVEDQLNAENDTVRYELLNFGVGGYGLSEYLVQLKNKVLCFEPDEVIIGFCAYNDHLIPEPGSLPDSIPPPAPNGFSICYLKRLIDLTFSDKYRPRQFAYTPERLHYVSDRLKAIQSVAQQHGVPISVIYLSNVYQPKEAAQVRAIAELLGIRFADTSYRFKDKSIGDCSLHALDAHPNKKANRIFSEELYRLIITGLHQDPR